MYSKHALFFTTVVDLLFVISTRSQTDTKVTTDGLPVKQQ